MATTPDDLHVVLEDFIMRLMSLAESDGMDAVVELDMSLSQARTLFLLAKTGKAMPINVIADRLGLSVAAAGRNVEQMVQLGLIERRESPDDRRVKLVSLTSRGGELALSHIDSKRESIKAFSQGLSPELRDNLHRALSDILASDTLRPRLDQENCL